MASTHLALIVYNGHSIFTFVFSPLSIETPLTQEMQKSNRMLCNILMKHYLLHNYDYNWQDYFLEVTMVFTI